MLRPAALAVVVLAGLGSISSALAGPPLPQQDILASGDTRLATIDANDNGMLNEPEDCVYTGKVRPDGSDLEVTGHQNSGPNELVGCLGSCFGNGQVNSDFADVTLNSCEFSFAPFVPLFTEFCESLQSCLSDNATQGAAGGGTAGGGIPTLTAGTIIRTSQGFRAGFGQLCRAAGPAVEITGDDGVKVLREIVPFPNASNPTHMCVHDIPVQLNFGGAIVFRTGCFPVRNGMVDFALSDNPDSPIALIAFDGALAPCGTARGAPTVSEWGLLTLIVALLGLGTLGLSRRRGFYQTVRLP